MNKKLSIQDLFYIFVISSILGWFVELIFLYIRKGIFVNHSSLVLGPFCLAYGFGGALLTLLLYSYEKKNIFYIFILSFISGTILEYIMSFGMELVMGFCAWDYSNVPLNINGRVCLLYSLFWGFLGIFWIKVIYPMFNKLNQKLHNKGGKIGMLLLSIFLIIDTLLTISAFIRVKQNLKGIPPKNQYEIFLDNHFGFNYLDNMYSRLEKIKEDAP